MARTLQDVEIPEVVAEADFDELSGSRPGPSQQGDPATVLARPGMDRATGIGAQGVIENDDEPAAASTSRANRPPARPVDTNRRAGPR